jgi:hypothetical protein
VASPRAAILCPFRAKCIIDVCIDKLKEKGTKTSIAAVPYPKYRFV